MFYRKRSGRWRWLIGIVIGGGILFLFRTEIQTLRAIAMYFINGAALEISLTLPQALYVGFFLALNAVAEVALSLLFFHWTACAVHPVEDVHQAYPLIRRVARSIFSRTSPIWVIREAAPVSGGRSRPSDLAIVDLESALVLEGRGARLKAEQPLNAGSGAGPSRSKMARIAKPGLVFIHPGERLRGMVSLRRQLRLFPDVLGQTSDGIEVKTNVYCLFTLGEPPSVVQVAYCGPQVPESLCVLVIDPETRKIIAILDELDGREKEEVHRFAADFLYCMEPDSPLVLMENAPEWPPFTIDEGRIEAAVYSKALSVSHDLPDSQWTDLPAMVAAEVFRNMIARLPYDSLYLPEDPGKHPLLSEVKPRFARQMRFLGALSYQFVHRVSGEPPETGQGVNHRQFHIAPVREFQSPKLLRDRGIKVVHAGFSELIPTDPKIKQQRFQYWQARWQQEAELIRADLDLEVMRLRNHARAQRQREMIDTLTGILKSSLRSEEALILRVFQALEDAAKDPNTRQMLPKDTLNLLGDLRSWLLPEQPPGSPILEEHLEKEEE